MKYFSVFLMFFLLFLGACFKPDNTPPVIFLNQISPLYITIGDSYIDRGITATDDRDGDITRLINVKGQVNSELAGEYLINYNLTDASGNKARQVEKIVYVRHRNFTLEGIYQAKCNCKIFPQDTAAFYSSIAASKLNQDEVLISDIIPNKQLLLNAFLNGNTSQKFYFQNKIFSDTLYTGNAHINDLGDQIYVEVYLQSASFKDTCSVFLNR